jgi:hypothetical protein
MNCTKVVYSVDMLLEEKPRRFFHLFDLTSLSFNRKRNPRDCGNNFWGFFMQYFIQKKLGNKKARGVKTLGFSAMYKNMHRQ